MRHKRKRLEKLLMALFPREDAEFYINVGLICDLDYAAQIRAVKETIKNAKNAWAAEAARYTRHLESGTLA